MHHRETATPLTARESRLIWKAEAATWRKVDRGRSSTRSNSPPWTIRQGKQSKPRKSSSARPKAATAMAYINRIRSIDQGPMEPNRRKRNRVPMGSVTTTTMV